ncbi:MAG: hypothetical protein J6Q22_10615 [Prevotella sp.]|nr:hypothetical protein [Prevotella sp.]
MKKISEFISELEKAKDEYGDLPIVVSDTEGFTSAIGADDPRVGKFDVGAFDTRLRKNVPCLEIY